MAKYLTFDPRVGDTILKSPTTDERKPFELIQTNQDGVIDPNLLPDNIKSSASSIILEMVAYEDILPYRALALVNQHEVKHFLETDVHVFGISLESVGRGNTLKVLVFGKVDDTPFNTNGYVYVHDGGLIQNTPSNTLYLKIGYVLNRTLYFNPETPIILSP